MTVCRIGIQINFKWTFAIFKVDTTDESLPVHNQKWPFESRKFMENSGPGMQKVYYMYIMHSEFCTQGQFEATFAF